MSNIFLGIDLGATNIKIGCFDSELKLLGKTSVAAYADMEPKVAVEQIGAAADKLRADNNLTGTTLTAVGIGSTGQFNLAEGFMISNPNLKLFQNVPLRKMLAERFARPVVLDNDGNAACYGEYVLGAGKGVDNMVFFTLGTGIGGGIILEGELVHGAKDNAAELGHIIIYPDGRRCGCGQRGCVEAYASASSTARRAAEAVKSGAQSSLKEVLDDKGRISCKDVFDHAKTGDTLAREITDGTAKALALVCVNMLHTTEPQRIIFAGGMIAAGPVLLNRIKHFFEEQIWTLKAETVEICFATLGEDAGLIGAAALARQAGN